MRRLVAVISRGLACPAREHRRIITVVVVAVNEIRVDRGVATIPVVISRLNEALSLIKCGLVWNTLARAQVTRCIGARRVYNCRRETGTTAYSFRFTAEPSVEPFAVRSLP